MPFVCGGVECLVDGVHVWVGDTPMEREDSIITCGNRHIYFVSDFYLSILSVKTLQSRVYRTSFKRPQSICNAGGVLYSCERGVLKIYGGPEIARGFGVAPVIVAYASDVIVVSADGSRVARWAPSGGQITYLPPLGRGEWPQIYTCLPVLAGDTLCIITRAVDASYALWRIDMLGPVVSWQKMPIDTDYALGVAFYEA
jgi:hypothetical protein